MGPASPSYLARGVRRPPHAHSAAGCVGRWDWTGRCRVGGTAAAPRRCRTVAPAHCSGSWRPRQRPPTADTATLKLRPDGTERQTEPATGTERQTEPEVVLSQLSRDGTDTAPPHPPPSCTCTPAAPPRRCTCTAAAPPPHCTCTNSRQRHATVNRHEIGRPLVQPIGKAAE